MIVANYVPLLIPSSGPNFYKFSDDARYEIHIDNDGDAKSTTSPIAGTFKDQLKNGNTFLYNIGPSTSLADPNLNVTQTYDLEKHQREDRQEDAASSATRPVAPWNVGKRSFPNYETVALRGGRSRPTAPRRSPVRATSRSSSTSTCSTCSASAARRPPTAST